MKRSQYEISRESEYFNKKELIAQTGQSEEKFSDVILKELLDNALDACETAGIAPEIDVVITKSDYTNEAEDFCKLTISVTDNGNGIDTEIIDRILNYQTRTSDKQVFRSPTRGSQGNALKTVFGIPFALAGENKDNTHPIIIESKGVRHTMLLWLDPAGKVRKEIKRENIKSVQGTKIIVTMQCGRFKDFDAKRWIRDFYLFNPHASFQLKILEENKKGKLEERSEAFKATVKFPDKWKKYIPTQPTSPWWYSTDDLRRLIFAEIGEIEEGRSQDITLREYLKRFKGIKGTKTGKVCKAMKGIKFITDFENKPNKVDTLLAELQAQSSSPSYRTLGKIGEEHFFKLFDEWCGISYKTDKDNSDKIEHNFWYFYEHDEVDGIPSIAEVAIAVTNEMGDLHYGVNFTPTFDDPFNETEFSDSKLTKYSSFTGIREMLRNQHAMPGSTTGILTVVAYHVICPTLDWTERGKSTLTNVK